MEKVYKNGGINDPDYCVLKFTAFSGRHYYSLETHTFEIE
jgi:general stress protein 26